MNIDHVFPETNGFFEFLETCEEVLKYYQK